MNQNLALNLAASSTERGLAPALRLDEAVLGYAQLDQAAARVAGLLRERGLRAGDRVGLMLPMSRISRLCITGCCGLAAWWCR